VLSRCHYLVNGRRDLRIDWLRGLAMTCVIINHSRMSSLLSWFSYERFWVVTAAEVFVLLSGIVLGTVYGRKLARAGWSAVVRGLGNRALTLYAAFVGVTVSVFVLSAVGFDVTSLTTSGHSPGQAVCSLDAGTISAALLRDVAFMRCGPWTFQIVGLYVWLVAAAVPCLLVLYYFGWRPLLALSWCAYFWYHVSPLALTGAQFESGFPILAWQLLFVHGIVIGYHREQLTSAVARLPRIVPVFIGGAAAAFTVFAFCNPWTQGPSWLQLSVVSPERFTYLYFKFFDLTDLGIGRLLNLAVALPVGYALLTWGWTLARPLGIVFVSLGEQSLGAFILHVYGVLLLANLPIANSEDLGINTLILLLLIVAIAGLLDGTQRLRDLRGRPVISTVPAHSVLHLNDQSLAA
jgi:hypothetical protein